MSKIFKPYKFLTNTITFGILHTSLICVVLIPYFKDSGMLPIQLSSLLLIKKVGRLVFDSFFGLMFDRFGAKPIFIVGRVCKLMSFLILLCKPSFGVFAISMLFDGISYSSIYGKIGAYTYNTLSFNNKLSFYPRAMSIYYFVNSAVISTMSFTASVLLKYYGYHFLVVISIFLNIFSILFMIFVIPKNTKQEDKKFVSKSLKDIVKIVLSVSKEKPQFLYLLLFYGLVNFFSWQFGSISAMILLDMGFKNSSVIQIGAMCKIAMAVGCFISFIFFKNGITIKNCLKIFSFFVFIGLIISFIYNGYALAVLMCIIVLAYTTIEVSIEKTLDKVSNPKIRGTAVSLAMTFCNIFTMLSIALVGIIAEIFSYQVGLIVNVFMVCAFLILIIKKLKNIISI